MARSIGSWLMLARTNPVGFERELWHQAKASKGAGAGGRRAAKVRARRLRKAALSVGFVRTTTARQPGRVTSVIVIPPQSTHDTFASADMVRTASSFGSALVSDLQALLPDLEEPFESTSGYMRSAEQRSSQRHPYFGSVPRSGVAVINNLDNPGRRKLQANRYTILDDRIIRMRYQVITADQSSNLNTNIDGSEKALVDVPQDYVVGVIDSGINEKHPEFQKNTVAAYLDPQQRRQGKPEKRRDYGTHGTAVCSLISGLTCGRAPGVRLAVAAALSSQKGTAGRVSDVVSAYNWLLGLTPEPRVINMSLQGEGPYEELFATLRASRERDITNVAAVGNLDAVSKPAEPGAYPFCVAVGALDGDKPWRGNATGMVVWDGVAYQKPDVLADGVNVRVAHVKGGYAVQTGSSMAAAVHTGTLAAKAIAPHPAAHV